MNSSGTRRSGLEFMRQRIISVIFAVIRGQLETFPFIGIEKFDSSDAVRQLRLVVKKASAHVGYRITRLADPKQLRLFDDDEDVAVGELLDLEVYAAGMQGN